MNQEAPTSVSFRSRWWVVHERCVYAVHKLISNSKIQKEMCVSHGMIGDSEDYFYNLA